jgi:protein-S-isoprenylcysteine O-methyltransferase Ste14
MRNPMLTGIFILLIGIGIFIESTSLLIIYTPLFILLNVIELKLIEEPELVMRLGEAYKTYRKTTPMFFPDFKQISHH